MVVYRLVLAVFIAAVISAVHSPTTTAWLRQGRTKSATMMKLVTAYLDTPIGRARQLGLEGRLGGEGTLVIDPNTCSLDAAGDTEVCTELAVTRIPVTLQPAVGVSLKKGDKRRLYEVEGRGFPRLRLVVPASKSQPFRLLILDHGGKVVRVVTLEAVH